MIVQDTIEGYIKYAKNLIANLHTRKTIDGSKAVIYDNFSGYSTVSIAPFRTATLRVVFTPSTGTSVYGEVGMATDLSYYNRMLDLKVGIFADPSYSALDSLAWRVMIYNQSWTDTISFSSSYSVTSTVEGTVTVTNI